MTVKERGKSSTKQISTIQFFGKVSLPMQTAKTVKDDMTNTGHRGRRLWRKKPADQFATARI
jgi:hypothetical protein